MVEDYEPDVFLIQEAIRLSGIDTLLHLVDNGEDAVQFFEDADQDSSIPCPDLVLLDLNLPKMNGMEVLRQMRQSARCSQAAVIIVSTSHSFEDQATVRRLGATHFFQKPPLFEEFMKLGALIKETMML